MSALLLLIALCLAWEARLAPLRPGGSWLMLKALPLLAPLPGLLHGRRFTAQWCSMLVLAYFTEGVVRAWSERGAVRTLAFGEIVLAAAVFGCAIGYARLSSQRRTA